ncbi:MAG: cytochrome c3 family protein [Candidatus Methylomirabilales bacterium]
MPKLKWLGVIVVVAVALLTGAFWWMGPAVTQPIEYPHKTHVEQLKLPCTGCHQRAEKDNVAGRPPTALCLACHAGGETKSEEVKKIRAFGEKSQEIPWKRVWRLPAYVFFPHRIHVAVAKVKCQTCHGPMETLTRPPARPLKTLAMNNCIGCHEKSEYANGEGAGVVKTGSRHVSTDCTTCHH